MSSKIDFKLKFIKREEERYFISVTGKIHQDDVYAPNTRTYTFVKGTLLKFHQSKAFSDTPMKDKRNLVLCPCSGVDPAMPVLGGNLNLKVVRVLVPGTVAVLLKRLSFSPKATVCSIYNALEKPRVPFG